MQVLINGKSPDSGLVPTDFQFQALLTTLIHGRILLFPLSLSQVKGPGVGLLGISKGAELCLSMASFLKGITAVVMINGSVVNVGGTLHYKDETLPPIGLDPNPCQPLCSYHLLFPHIVDSTPPAQLCHRCHSCPTSISRLDTSWISGAHLIPSILPTALYTSLTHVLQAY